MYTVCNTGYQQGINDFFCFISDHESCLYFLNCFAKRNIKEYSDDEIVFLVYKANTFPNLLCWEDSSGVLHQKKRDGLIVWRFCRKNSKTPCFRNMTVGTYFLAI